MENVFNQKQNNDALLELREIITHANRGFYLYTAPTAQEVSRVSEILKEELPDTIAVLDFAQISKKDLTYSELLSFANSNPERILLLINFQAIPISFADTAQSLNMSRDSLSALQRVWIIGTTPNYKYELERSAYDFHSYIRLFVEFCSEEEQYVWNVEHNKGFSIDLNLNAGYVGELIESLESESNEESRHAIIGMILRNCHVIKLSTEDRFGQWMAEYEQFIPSIPSLLTQALDYAVLAKVYRKMNSFNDALEYASKTSAIQEKMLGEEHPDTAATYSSIARIYSDKANYEQALAYYRKELRICEKVFGMEHPNTAATYNDIAVVYRDIGNYKQALAYYEKALAIRERVLGKEHPNTAMTYKGLGFIYHTKGDYEQAVEYYKKALEILERKFGNYNPDVTEIYHFLAMIYEEKGDYRQAMYYEQMA